MMPWKDLVARTAVVGAIVSVFVGGAVFVGMRLAGADPGGPASPNSLTYAGVLRPPPGGALPPMVNVTFEFNHRVRGNVCSVPVTNVPIASSGAFSTDVSLAGCPNRGRDLFDGNEVTYNVRQTAPTTEVLAERVAITPVPYARFADQVGVNNDCPAGYVFANDTTLPVGATLCRRGVDEVVKVGQGATTFWIDRYEASVFSSADGTGVQFGSIAPDYPARFPGNGLWSVRVYALSTRLIPPSRFITWFQANEACRISGKRLPTGDEWLSAARGTDDPGADPGGSNGRCRTMNTEVRNTGNGLPEAGTSGCVSLWGAMDMIGNVAEWTAEWYAGLGATSPFPSAQWPTVLSGNDDRVWNIASFTRSINDATGPAAGLPSAALRGGNFSDRTDAGIFYLNLNHAPSYSSSALGFRCVIPR